MTKPPKALDWYPLFIPSARRRGDPIPDWFLRKVRDRTRTGDHLDHNQELYQLSYAHRAGPNLALDGWLPGARRARYPRQDSNLRPSD